MIIFQVEQNYKEVSIKILADLDTKVKEIVNVLSNNDDSSSKISYDSVVCTLLKYGYELYKAENENKEYACDEIVFCQACSKLALKYRKFTYREEVYKFCTNCVLQAKHINKLRILEENYQSKQFYESA